MRKKAPDTVTWVRTLEAQSHTVGICFVVAATAFMSAMDALAKSLLDDLHVVQIVWARAFFGLLVMLPLIARGPLSTVLRPRMPRLQIIRAFLYLGANICFFSALVHLPLAETVAIAFVAPLFITALSVPLLGETVGVRRWAAVAVGLGGALVIIRPGWGMFHWAALWAVGAAACYALFQIVTRRIGSADPPTTTLFCSNLVVMLIATILVPFVWVGLFLEGWAMLAMIGLLGTVASFLLIKAYASTPASLLAPFQYTELLWATTLGYIVFRDIPGMHVVAGSVIIAGSGLYTWRRELRKGRF